VRPPHKNQTTSIRRSAIAREGNDELMRWFWVAWEGDYVKDVPKHVREQDVSDATNAGHKLRPSYYLSPRSGGNFC
jgi:hypothetical protein